MCLSELTKFKQGNLITMKKIIVLILLIFSMHSFAEDIPINAGDSIGISVYNNPDLALKTTVSNNGKINYPLIGEVKIGGLTVRDAERIISNKLIADGFLRDAQVNIIMLDSKSQQVSVLGEVRSPGLYSISATSKTLIDFISLAGGKIQSSSDRIIVLSQGANGFERIEINLDKLFKSGNLSTLTEANLNLNADDIIYVPKAPLFYIYGNVNRPGVYPLRDRMSVAQALSVGGGVSLRGTERGLEIKRRSASGELETIDVKDSTEVLENDVIYVEESLF